ncbi:AraC family transcriptional regulator [Cohnella fermenti]|uniref:AraC family transcriptional regulator n=1 Tax=Cohnella fermenti TaxID=2565925 RepID=A0A4S4C7L2_9BACL|nr:AraC family transcriptional regulator [Cohnella fermenti]THF83279.1 AraC family transcriptional regulator [Cohnella fermenti]
MSLCCLRFVPRRIECYSLHLVYEGSVRLESEGVAADLRKGDLFCLFPDRTYDYRIVPDDEPLRMSWLAIDGGRVGPLLALAGITPERPYARRRLNALVKEAVERTIAGLIRAERPGPGPAEALLLQASICELFARLMPGDASGSGCDDEPIGWLRDCLSFMELHAAEGVTVQQVADYAGIHRSYFSSRFARLVGMSPQKYLQKIRMDKASRLLAETEATITEIALSLGYPNLYTFTRAFKTYFKATPMACRAAGGRA